MSALEIVMLVGFATGAALHLYITWLIARREDLWGPEPAFVALGLTLGVWHVGSLFAALFRILNVADGHLLLRTADTVVLASLSFLPPTLAHAHVSFLGWRDDYRRVTRRAVRAIATLGYIPLLLLPVALSRLWGRPYANPVEAMGFWLALFSIWHVAVLFQSAVVDQYVKRYFEDPRERGFFDRLSISLVVIGVTYLAVFPGGMRELPSVGPWLEVLVQLASIVPTTIVAYYIFRYNLYKLVIQKSLVYALLAGIAMVVYLYVVRTADQFLAGRFDLKPGVIEAIGVVFMVLVAWPVRRAMDASVRQLFDTEIGHYRSLVEQVSTESHSFNELRALLPYVERIVTEALGVDAVRIRLTPDDQAPAAGDERAIAALWQAMVRERLDALEDDPRVWALGARAAWGLWRDDELVGLMLIASAAGAMDSKKEAVLGVLSGQIAIAIENCRLVEEKVRLERELMHRERLAALGQMAATVAHEVKNPLSSIKSIVQVMREEEEEGPRSQDLRLIVGEVDRLSRTVTQLLSFSRPAMADAQVVSLAELADATARLLEADASAAGATLGARVDGNRDVPGAVASAIREVLINLALNAIQAVPPGGRVDVTLSATDAGVRLEVEDTGPGIPEALVNKVREPFFTTKLRGTGLGLAIVDRRLAEVGGRLRLESPLGPNGGTRATVDIVEAADPRPPGGVVDKVHAPQ
jgi:signal transduction histidine kinase